jgi:hypothetical protein
VWLVGTAGEKYVYRQMLWVYCSPHVSRGLRRKAAFLSLVGRGFLLHGRGYAYRQMLWVCYLLTCGAVGGGEAAFLSRVGRGFLLAARGAARFWCVCRSLFGARTHVVGTSLGGLAPDPGPAPPLGRLRVCDVGVRAYV